MATPEENLEAALARAAKARAEGNESRAATWEASADRYRRIIQARETISNARNNLAAIQERLTQSRALPTPTNQEPPTQPSPVSGTTRTTRTGSNVDTQEDRRVSSVSPTPATPTNTSPVTSTPPPAPVKTAPIDTILYPSDDLLPIEIMSDLIFENIGGQELINIARNDTVNGQPIVYQPIRNLTQIQQQYNPNNIISLQATSDKYFQNFAIKLETKVPERGNGPAGAHVYIDPNTGNLVVEAINLEPDEQVELEITTSGTIYEAEL